MIKLLLILLVGLVFESTGVILLKKGMNVIGEMRLKIDAKSPGRKFKFIVDKMKNDEWDIKIQFEKPLHPDSPTTKD